jgi:hypothetical protein
MTNVVMEQLRHLGGTLGELRVRVRAAVAGEVGRAVADAVREVVGLALAGHGQGRAPARSTGYDRYDAYGLDTWDDEPSRRWASSGYDQPEPVDAEPGPADQPPLATVLAVALTAGKWWFARSGTPWGATALGVAVAGAVLTGGPVARAAVAALWAAHRLLAATDALGDGAKALDRV